MKKSDLKDWMVVECRDGGKFVVNLQQSILSGIRVYLPLTSYNEDMSHYRRKTWDIVAIYKSSSKSLSKIMSGEYLECTWKRVEETPKQKEIREIREQMERLSSRLKELEK